MDSICRKYWQLGMPCPPAHALPTSGAPADLGASLKEAQANTAGERGVVFGGERQASAAPIPGYNALAPHIRTVRDPALSLIALSGIDPTDPVMVEVPLVLNNTTFTDSHELSGWRIGYALRYVRGSHVEFVEHTAAFCRALDILRHAGAQLVPVDARRADETLQFELHTRNEIDDLVTEHRLDALVCDAKSVAFHGACSSGYPSLCEPLKEGSTLWVYGARWSRDAVQALVRTYRQISVQ